MRCWVKSPNERNPCDQLPARQGGDSDQTAGVKPEEGGDDVKSSWPLCPGLHTCYNGADRASPGRRPRCPQKPPPSSDCGLTQPARMKPESLVIADQHCGGECVPYGKAATARQATKAGGIEVAGAARQAPKMKPVMGTKS